MGAGKTTIGRELSRRLNLKFVDLDDMIVASAGKPIPQIFATEGETGFRHREHEALQSLIASLSEPAIVSLGGGAFVQPDNLDLIRKCGIPSVFLDARIDTLLKRCHAEKGSRPLAQDENQFRQLYEQRRSGYMKADHCVQTGEKAVRDIVHEIMSRLGWSNEVIDSSPVR